MRTWKSFLVLRGVFFRGMRWRRPAGKASWGEASDQTQSQTRERPHSTWQECSHGHTSFHAVQHECRCVHCPLQRLPVQGSSQVTAIARVCFKVPGLEPLVPPVRPLDKHDGRFFRNLIDGNPQWDNVTAVHGVIALIVMPRGALCRTGLFHQDMLVVNDASKLTLSCKHSNFSCSSADLLTSYHDLQPMSRPATSTIGSQWNKSAISGMVRQLK